VIQLLKIPPPKNWIQRCGGG